MLAMMNTAVVVGLEGLPEIGGFGLSLIFFYAIFTIIYFLPVGLVSAELGVGWPGEGGVYRWVKEAIGMRDGVFGDVNTGDACIRDHLQEVEQQITLATADVENPGRVGEFVVIRYRSSHLFPASL